MTSFLRGLLHGRNTKHKKLLEDWNSAGKEDEGSEAVSSGSETTKISKLSPSRSSNTRSGTSRSGNSKFGTSKTKRPSLSESIGSESANSILVKTSEESDSSNFYVKYLGSTLVSTPNGKLVTSDAIRAVIAMTKLSGRKLQRVMVSINLNGIRVTDTETNAVQFDISIYRISYCSADATFNHVFAFIATNSNETMECHAFLCRRKKLAQHATLAIARTFHTAFELWQMSHEGPSTEDASPAVTAKNTDFRKKKEKARLGCKTKKSTNGKRKQVESAKPLIDFSDDLFEITNENKFWVQFDDDEKDVQSIGIPNEQSYDADLKDIDYFKEKPKSIDQAGAS